MTEKIKKALVVWAEKIIKNESQWDSEHVHQAIQKLYELSVCQKFLMEETPPKSELWSRQQAALSSVLENLTGPTTPSDTEKIEELEVPPMMETIKNMVTEMPESENYDRLFETVQESPVFIPKEDNTAREVQKETKLKTRLDAEERKNLNDKFAQQLSIDLNDRLAFIKHLFEENVSAYEAVLSQIITYSSWEEVADFIQTKVKIEYPHWKEKEAVEARFMATLQLNFSK